MNFKFTDTSRDIGSFILAKSKQTHAAMPPSCLGPADHVKWEKNPENHHADCIFRETVSVCPN